MPCTVRSETRSIARAVSLLLVLFALLSVLPSAVRAAGVSSGPFYPATTAAYNTWINSTSNALPKKVTTFPAGTSVVAFYFEYHSATPKVTTYQVSVYDAGGTLVNTAGPYKAQYKDGLVMRTVPGPKDGPFPNGNYHAVLHVAGTPDLTTTFSVGSRAVGITIFYATTRAAYDTWTNSKSDARPAQTSSFPAKTSEIAFYFEYTKADTHTNTFQIVIRDQKGTAVGTGKVHKFPYVDGLQMLIFGGSGYIYDNGSYRADLSVDGQVVTSIYFSVGVALQPKACVAKDYIATCLEPSILRLHADLPGNMVAEGTGFVIRSDSTGTYLLTNKHVVDGATPQVMKAYTADGGTYYPVLAIARNSAGEGTAGDLAVVKLPPTNLHPLTFGDSSTLTLLQPVISIGYGDALDLPGPPTVTQGSISALNRDLGDGFGPIWIQHQSFINHGNSGGPLMDSTYHVIGINTLSPKDTQGIFFAIPSNFAKPIAEQLIAKISGVQ